MEIYEKLFQLKKKTKSRWSVLSVSVLLRRGNFSHKQVKFAEWNVNFSEYSSALRYTYTESVSRKVKTVLLFCRVLYVYLFFTIVIIISEKKMGVSWKTTYHSIHRLDSSFIRSKDAATISYAIANCYCRNVLKNLTLQATGPERKEKKM